MQHQTGTVQPIGSIEQGWNLIKNDYWLFFGMTTLMIVIVIALAFILQFILSLIAIPINMAIGAASVPANDSGKIALSIIPSIVAQVLGVFSALIVGTITGMLTCGIYTAFSRRAANGQASFSDLFEGFQYFKQAFVVSAIMAVVNFILNLVFIISAAALGLTAVFSGILTPRGEPNWAILSGIIGILLVFFLIYFLILLIISALTVFVYPLIAERKVSAFQAFGMSFNAALRNLLSIILLLILLFLISLAGAAVCGIGIFFVIPILSATIFTAYTQVFGLSGNNFNRYAPPPPPVFNNQPGF